MTIVTFKNMVKHRDAKMTGNQSIKKMANKGKLW